MVTIPRRPGEGIVIGDSIIITVLDVDAERVRLVIENRNNRADVQIVECRLSSLVGGAAQGEAELS